MRASIQHKINSLKALAAKSKSNEATAIAKSYSQPTTDNLSKAIRNAHDAKVFNAELNSAIALAKK